MLHQISRYLVFWGGIIAIPSEAVPFDDGYGPSGFSQSPLIVPVTFAVQKARDLVVWELGEEAGDELLIGACFSGGGSRSDSLVRGQLAVLDNLAGSDGKSYLDRIRYFSAVSGGAWGISAYLSSSMELDKQVVLGAVNVNLTELFAGDKTNTSKNNINWMGEHSLGRVPQRLGGLFQVGGRLAWEVVNPWGNGDKAWSSLINEKLLKPYMVPSYMKMRNCCNQGRGKRKELIVVSAVRDDKGDVHLLELTPKSAGIRAEKNNLGGYMIAPEGFNRKIHSRDNSTVTIYSGREYTLAEALSASSDHYAHLGNVLKSELPEMLSFGPAILRWLVNTVVPDVYYPTLKEHTSHFEEKNYELVDAGPVDYFGLTPLLARGVKKIILFVNTDKPIVTRDGGDKTIIGMEKAIPSFFGVCPDEEAERTDYVAIRAPSCTRFPLLRNNQVFESGEYGRLAKGLLDARGAGRSVVYLQTGLRVIPNSFYAIAGDYHVDLFWVYNDLPDDWLHTLPPDIRHLVKNDECGTSCPGPLSGFPHNSATYELGLTEAQSNLLILLAVDTLGKSADQLRSFFESTSP